MQQDHVSVDFMAVSLDDVCMYVCVYVYVCMYYVCMYVKGESRVKSSLKRVIVLEDEYHHVIQS